jgi:hypothetical protein
LQKIEEAQSTRAGIFVNAMIGNSGTANAPGMARENVDMISPPPLGWAVSPCESHRFGRVEGEEFRYAQPILGAMTREPDWQSPQRAILLK